MKNVNATPNGTRMMWKPRVNAICSRAGSSCAGSPASARNAINGIVPAFPESAGLNSSAKTASAVRLRAWVILPIDAGCGCCWDGGERRRSDVTTDAVPACAGAPYHRGVPHQLRPVQAARGRRHRGGSARHGDRGLSVPPLDTPAASLRPNQQGLTIAKDVWMFGIGLILLIDGLGDDER